MDALAEWLRRRPAKPMGSPRVGSNPTGVAAHRTAFLSLSPVIVAPLLRFAMVHRMQLLIPLVATLVKSSLAIQVANDTCVRNSFAIFCCFLFRIRMFQKNVCGPAPLWLCSQHFVRHCSRCATAWLWSASRFDMPKHDCQRDNKLKLHLRNPWGHHHCLSVCGFAILGLQVSRKCNTIVLTTVPRSSHRPRGVTVSTLDSESSDRGSNPREALLAGRLALP